MTFDIISNELGYDVEKQLYRLPLGHTLEVQKVKVLNPTQIQIKYTQTKTATDTQEAVISDIECTMRHEVHQDLLNALECVKPYMIDMCQQPEIGVYEINQIVWGGEKEYRGVTLCGNRELKENRKLNLNSPFCTFNEDVAWYDAWMDLERACSRFEREVELYLCGKFAPSKQMELEFEPTIKED